MGAVLDPVPQGLCPAILPLEGHPLVRGGVEAVQKTFTDLLLDFLYAGHRWHSLRRGGGRRPCLPPLPQRPLFRLVRAVATAGHGSRVRSGVP